MKVRAILSGVLVAFGLIQIIAIGLHLPQLRLLALAGVASPLPPGYTPTQGLRSYSSTSRIRAALNDGSYRSVIITPATFARLNGPYSRRFLYHSALFDGPDLSQALSQSILNWGLCSYGPLARSFALGKIAGWAVEVWDRSQGRGERFIVKADCEK